MSNAAEVYQASFQDIVAGYQKGATIASLAEEYGISAPTVSRWLKKAGVKRKRRKWLSKGIIFDTRFAEIAEMYERGMEMKDIATQFDVTATTIRNWLIKGGYKRRTKGRVPFAMKARAHDLQSRGWRSGSIGLLFNEKPSEVEKWLSEPTPALKPAFENPGTKPTQKMRIRGRRKKNPTIPKPPKHRCKTKWTDEERQYVSEMIGEGYSIKEIYDQTGASRARQNRIMRDLGLFRPMR